MRLEQRASELPTPVLFNTQHKFLWFLSVILMTSSCSLTTKVTTSRKYQQVVTTATDLQHLEYYLNEFEREVKNGNEVDMQIAIEGLSDAQIYTTFKRISNSVKNNRFIGVIQPCRTYRYRPEESPIKYDRIKFHIHNTKHDNSLAGTGGISSLQIVITKVQHLAII